MSDFRPSLWFRLFGEWNLLIVGIWVVAVSVVVMWGLSILAAIHFVLKYW